MAIIISKEGKTEVVPPSDFEGKEDVMQEYILNHPQSIPVYEIDENKKLFVAAREFPSGSGGDSIDAIAIDKDGDIYIVETKLYKNPDKRLVVAQVLDYGAALWKNMRSFAEFKEALDEKTRSVWGMSFLEKVEEQFGLEGEEIEAIRDAIERNLHDGNLKYVVLMNAMDDRLKDIITYVNRNSNFSIYPVELEHYRYDEYEIVIPKLYGSEVKKEYGATQTRVKGIWNEEKFFEDAKKRLSEGPVYDAVKKFYEFSKSITGIDISWGSGRDTGSFNPKLNRISPRSLCSMYTDGKLSLNLGWLSDSEAGERFVDALVDHLAKIPEIPKPNQHQLQKGSLVLTPDQWVPKTDEIVKIIGELTGKV